MAFIQKHGFSTPLFFQDKTGLDIKVPKPEFTVSDVRQCVGVYVFDSAYSKNKTQFVHHLRFKENG